MNGYIYNRTNKVISDIITNVTEVKEKDIIGDAQIFGLNFENVDFVVTDSEFKIGDIINLNEVVDNRSDFIKKPKEEDLQSQIDFLTLQILDLMGV